LSEQVEDHRPHCQSWLFSDGEDRRVVAARDVKNRMQSADSAAANGEIGLLVVCHSLNADAIGRPVQSCQEEWVVGCQGGSIHFKQYGGGR
jgi:hypothetical protein